MKKILIFILLIVSINGLSQTGFPATQSMATSSTKLLVNGGMQATKGIINGVFTDTTAANADYIDFYNGAQIYTRSDRNFWLRDSVANMWIRMAKFSETGGGTPSLTATQVAYGDGSNLITSSSGLTYNAAGSILSTLHVKSNDLLIQDFNSVSTPPSGYVNIFSDSHGLVYAKNDAGTVVELTNVSSSTPTLQQVLTAGSNLTGNNTINAATHNLTIDSVSVLAFYDENHNLRYYQDDLGTAGGTTISSADGGKQVTVTNSKVWLFTNNVGDSIGSTVLTYSPSSRLVPMVQDTVTGKWYRQTISGGGGGTGSNLSWDAANHQVDIDGGGTPATIPYATTATDGLISSSTQIIPGIKTFNSAIQADSYVEWKSGTGSVMGVLGNRSSGADDYGSIDFQNDLNANIVHFSILTPTATRNINLPNASGTVALTSDIPASLIYNESVVKSNDSVYLKNEKTYPPTNSTAYYVKNNVIGFHAIATLELADVQDFDRLEYDADDSVWRNFHANTLNGKMEFITDDPNFPNPGDSIMVDSNFVDRHVEVYRDGDFQYRTGGAYYYESDSLSGQIIFHPPLTTGERVTIFTSPIPNWSYLSRRVAEPPPSWSDIDYNAAQDFEELTTDTWTVKGAASSPYHAVIDPVKLPSGINGAYRVQTLASNNGLIGMDATNTDNDYGNWDFWAEPSGDGLIRVGENTTSSTLSGFTWSTGDYIAIWRVGSTVTCQRSSDGTTWTVIYTYTGTTSGDLYAKGHLDSGSNTIFNPQGYHLE